MSFRQGARQFFERRGAPTPPLPYDAEVEYLESTGTQYIDLGFSLTPSSDLYATVMLRIAVSNGVIFGQSNQFRWGANNPAYAIANSSAGKIFFAYGPTNNLYISDIGAGTLADISYVGTTYTINGTTTTIPRVSSWSAIQGNAHVFCRGIANGTTSSISKARVYSIKFVDNGATTHDLIPVRKGTVGYLYDRVSGTLFGNAGTGAFLYGRDTNPISARSYVQDGLVAMWDGIENAGWGVHDANATTWKDLVDSDDMSFNLTPTVDADGFTYPDGGYSSSSIARTLNAYTIEICGDLRHKTNTNDVFSFQRKVEAQISYGVPYIILGSAPDFFYSPVNNVPTIYSTVALTVDEGTKGTSFASGIQLPGANVVQIADSVFVIVNSLRTRIGNSKSRKFHAIRLYSRALTADEISANYAIDKRRFNLP